MSTTIGNMESFKVTDKDGNVYIMTPVDPVAQAAINGAKNLEFDEQYFTAEVSQDEKTVSVGLNGVPIGVDTDSPLKFVQDTPQGIVLGSDAPFSTALASEYDPTATYAFDDYCMHLGNYYRCTTAIPVAEAWNSAHWTETSIIDTISAIRVVPASTSSDENKVLTVDNTGTPQWTGPIASDPFGTQLLDENDSPVLDEDNEPVFDNAAATNLWTSFSNQEFGARRAYEDQDGQNIKETYATKSELLDARNIDAIDVAAVSGGVTTVRNNYFNRITGTIPATLTLNCVPATGKTANFAAQVTAGNTDSTLVVQVNGQPTLYNKAAGNTLEAYKTYQISCLNNCWTMAAFEVPT